MIAFAFAEQPTQPLLVDQRRITEHSADYQRLHAVTARRLRGSVNQLVRELRLDPHDASSAQSRFIQRHMGILRDAYLAAHREGQRDYYAPVSRTPQRWVQTPPTALVQKRLTFYGLGSVLKMAREAVQAVTAQRHALSEAYTLADDPVDAYLANVSVRADLQAQVVWTGMQDGYVYGGGADPVNIYSLVYWVLEPAAQHCNQCPELAADSPYNAPGLGGHELPATPGDGFTDCGAGCKCSLEYRPAGAIETQQLDTILRAIGQSGIIDLPSDGLPAGPSSVPDDGFSHNQMRALDLYRATARAWDDDRFLPDGQVLPTFPPFVANWVGWEGWDELNWDALPPKQQQLINQMLEARLLWGTPDGVMSEGE